MDFPILQAVTRSGLPSSQRLIMLLMLNHANTEGRAWPSHATLAREAGLSERSVWAHVNALEQSGWLVKVGSLHRVAIFQVADPAAAAASTPQEMQASATPSPQHLPDDPAMASAHPATVAAASRKGCGQTTHEPLNNPPSTTHRETARPSEGEVVGQGESMLQPSGALRRPGDVPKRQRSGALQDAAATPPLPVTTDGTGSLKTQPPKPRPQGDWREWNRRLAEEANAVAPEPTLDMPADFHAAWQGWQAYRTRRATEARISSEAVRWTRDAAEAGLRECARAAAIHGWPAVIARIDQAISGGWQGINTDKISPAGPQRSAQAQHQRSDTTNPPGRYGGPPRPSYAVAQAVQTASLPRYVPMPPPPAPPPSVPASREEHTVVTGSAYFMNQLHARARC